ncbi:MAG: hypothetical protein MUF87_13115 [Anaerolineae bacterium]|jgi:hypothetical protein|nr:hypothetical protein [Anaerolineae bacterium]
MSQENIFADEWRICLEEHYKHVVQHDPNPNNLLSLKKALLQPNGERPPIFTESELADLHLRVTLRADQMPDDYVPEVLLAAPEIPTTITETHDPVGAHPLECQCPSCIQINRIPHDHDGQRLDEDQIAALIEELRTQVPEDRPQQLSLF